MSSSEDEIISKALPVKPFSMSSIDPNAVPATAEEYLQKVIWEAKQCEEVVTVKLDETKVRKSEPVVKKTDKMRCPAEYIPSSEMQEQFMSQFSHLRDKIGVCREQKNIPSSPIRLPGEKKKEEWCTICFGNEFQRDLLLRQGKSEADLPESVEPNQPLLSILLNIPPQTLENLLDWHANWLQVAGFSELQGRWFFSLLACLQKPLTPETCSVLRSVVKNAAVIRASLDSGKHPHLVQLNMLITIITRYFGQTDLADS